MEFASPAAAMRLRTWPFVPLRLAVDAECHVMFCVGGRGR